MFYYVTPFAAGESLRDRLSRTGRLQLPNALRLLRDVTRALAYAHRQGIVHRDIKPGNILLNEDGDALICDFGVAKAVQAASEDSSSHAHEVTARGLILGTPAYIAPEQISDHQSVDHRADLYSLGVVAYEALTGSAPFTGRGAHEQLAAHLAEVPEPVSSRQPDVPAGIASIVDRLLAKRPADRPQDAEEVLEYIEAEIAGRPVPLALRPEHASGSSEARELYVKGRFLFSTRQRDAMLGALEHFRQAVARDATFAPAHAGIADVCNLLGLFGHMRPHEIFPQARAAAERAIQLDPRLAEGHAALGHLLHAYEWNWSGAAAALEKAIALNPQYPAARMYYGSYLHAVGRPRDALTQLEAARTIDPLAPVGMLTGRIHVDLGRPDFAIEVLRNELELDPRRDLAHQLLAHAFLQKGMHADAIASMQRAADMSGPRDIAQLAYIYAATGDRARARQILEDLVAGGAQCRHLGFHLAMAYGELGDADEAFAWLDAAFDERGSFMVLLAVSTGFHSIRRDPRFGRLLKRMGLANTLA
jgi:tetratricopeptide (TPR) repeat protein